MISLVNIQKNPLKKYGITLFGTSGRFRSGFCFGFHGVTFGRKIPRTTSGISLEKSSGKNRAANIKENFKVSEILPVGFWRSLRRNFRKHSLGNFQNKHFNQACPTNFRKNSQNIFSEKLPEASLKRLPEQFSEEISEVIFLKLLKEFL